MRIAAVEHKRLGSLRPLLRHHRGHFNRHRFFLHRLKCRHLRVVVTLAVGPENFFPLGGDRLGQLGGLLSLLLAGREGPIVKPRSGPGDAQPLAMLPLEIVEPDRQASRLERDCGLLRLTDAVDAVIFDNRCASDRESGAVVRIEREGVVAIGRHLEKAGEDIAEGIGPQRRGHADIEKLTGHGANILCLEAVEIGQLCPGVAVEAEGEIVEIARLRRRSGGVVSGGQKLCFDRGNGLLGGIDAALPILHAGLMLGTHLGAGEDRPLH